MPEPPASSDEPNDIAPRRVIVTLADDAMADIEAVTRRLEEAGLAVTETLEILGQIVGDWSGSDLGPLRAVDGVADVSESRGFQLPPPSSIIQ